MQALISPLFVEQVSAQTNTTCRQNGNVTTCRSTPGGGIDWSLLNQAATTDDAANAYEAGLRERQRRDAEAQAYAQGLAQLDAIKQEKAETEAMVARYKTAGALLRAGKCDDARTYALNSGDIKLAREVDDLCRKP